MRMQVLPGSSDAVLVAASQGVPVYACKALLCAVTSEPLCACAGASHLYFHMSPVSSTVELVMPPSYPLSKWHSTKTSGVRYRRKSEAPMEHLANPELAEHIAVLRALQQRCWRYEAPPSEPWL